MTTDREHPIAQMIRRTARSEADRLSDRELLNRYVQNLDAAAFETLVHRHGGVVWNVCRSVLGDSPATEDAFQATFLVLVRKAGAIRRPEVLANWLHGVAHRIACRAWKTRSRSISSGDVMATAHPDTRVDDRDTARVLHDELRKLPAKYASPLVLCYLEGRSTEEAAEELRWPVGTVKVYLMRGRESLKNRLLRRGVTSAAWGSVLVAPSVASSAPATVIEQTLRSAEALAGGGSVGSAVLSLVRGELHTVLWARVFTTIGLGLLVAGIGVRTAFHASPVLSLPTNTTQAPAVKPDHENLQGTWDITALELDGQKLAEGMVNGSKIILKGNAFTTISMGAEYEGTFRLDPDASPKTIDMTFTKGPKKGNTALGIYQLDGDTWTICLTVTAKARPTKFAAAKGRGVALETLKRGRAVATAEPAPMPRPAKAAPNDAEKKELERFAGEWEMVSGTIGGQAMPDMMLKTMKRVVKGHEATVTMGGQVYFKATISLDPTKTPRTIDYAMTEGMTKGKLQLGIYEWEDGTLRFSFASPGKDRPADFTSKADDGRTVSVWRRIQK